MIVALTGQKGGSGKTTSSISLADEFHRRGHTVLLVDTDPQGTARTWGDVAGELGVDGPTVIGMGSGFHEKLRPIADGYDVVVIDCPPGHGELQRAALMTADVAVIPSGPGATDIWSMAETIALTRQAMAIRPKLTVGILLTRTDARTVIAEQARDILEESEIPVWRSTFGQRVAFQEAPNAGVGVTRYAPGSAAAREVQALVDEIERTQVPALREVI